VFNTKHVKQNVEHKVIVDVVTYKDLQIYFKNIWDIIIPLSNKDFKRMMINSTLFLMQDS